MELAVHFSEFIRSEFPEQQHVLFVLVHHQIAPELECVAFQVLDLLSCELVRIQQQQLLEHEVVVVFFVQFRDFLELLVELQVGRYRLHLSCQFYILVDAQILFDFLQQLVDTFFCRFYFLLFLMFLLELFAEQKRQSVNNCTKRDSRFIVLVTLEL